MQQEIARYATGKGWLLPHEAASAVGRLSSKTQDYPSWVPESERHRLLWMVRASAMEAGTYTTVDGEHADAVRAAQVKTLNSPRIMRRFANGDRA